MGRELLSDQEVGDGGLYIKFKKEKKNPLIWYIG